MDLLVRFQGSLSKVTDSQLLIHPDGHNSMTYSPSRREVSYLLQ